MSTDDDATEPAPLRVDAARMVGHWREAAGMPRGAQARVWRRLDGSTRTEPMRGIAPVWTLALALAAALVLVWWVLSPSSRVVAQRGAPGDQASDRRAGTVGSTAASRTPVVATPPLPPAELPAAAPSPAAAPPTIAPDPASPIRREPRPRVAEPDDVPVASPSTLARERALIEGAWAALADGDPAGAVQRAAEHERAFADGVLAPERRAIVAIARCTRDEDGARERARTWLAAEPRSPLAARVRAACAVQ